MTTDGEDETETKTDEKRGRIEAHCHLEALNEKTAIANEPVCLKWLEG